MELATHESGLADRVRQKDRGHRVYSMHGRESRSAGLQLEDAWDRHGRSIYALACTLLGDREAAAQAVTLGMTDLARSAHRGSAADARRRMARHVYWRTQELTAHTPTLHQPPAMAGLGRLAQLQRACLALCVFGGHTYREAAGLLGVPPVTVAELLTAGLREVGRFTTEPASTSSRTTP
jgi:DNA-directed RNA polymerase specialized sigma24 family protein